MSFTNKLILVLLIIIISGIVLFSKRFKKRRPVQNTFFVVLYTGRYLIFELFFLFYV